MKDCATIDSLLMGISFHDNDGMRTFKITWNKLRPVSRNVLGSKYRIEFLISPCTHAVSSPRNPSLNPTLAQYSNSMWWKHISFFIVGGKENFTSRRYQNCKQELQQQLVWIRKTLNLMNHQKKVENFQ